MPEATHDSDELIQFVKEARALGAEREAEKAELGKIAESVVDALIKAGELDVGQREQAIRNVVNNPVKVAMCLKTTADALIANQQQKQAAPAAMGSGAEINKIASVKTAQRSAADHAFLTRLGLA